jgi:post-segregation antitoxin (ccd killing protein)
MTFQTKQKITLTIDTDIYLKIKTSGLNMSSIFQDYIKAYFFEEEQPLKASDEIQEELEKTKKTLEKLQINLFKAKQEEKKAFDERLERAKAIDQAKKAARVLDFD